MPIPAKILERVKHLQAMAESHFAQDPDHPEGKLARQRMIELMTRHAIDEAMLAADDPNPPTPQNATYVVRGGNWGLLRAQFVMDLCSAFGIACIMNTYVNHSTNRATRYEILQVGLEPDLETANPLADLLLVQLDREIEAVKRQRGWNRRSPASKTRYLKSMILAWSAGIGQRVMAAYRLAAEAAENATGHSTEIVLRTNYDTNRDTLRQQLSERGIDLDDMGQTPVFAPTDGAGVAAGFAAADRADIGQTRTGAAPHSAGALGTGGAS